MQKKVYSKVKERMKHAHTHTQAISNMYDSISIHWKIIFQHCCTLLCPDLEVCGVQNPFILRTRNQVPGLWLSQCEAERLGLMEQPAPQYINMTIALCVMAPSKDFKADSVGPQTVCFSWTSWLNTTFCWKDVAFKVSKFPLKTVTSIYKICMHTNTPHQGF